MGVSVVATVAWKSRPRSRAVATFPREHLDQFVLRPIMTALDSIEFDAASPGEAIAQVPLTGRPIHPGVARFAEHATRMYLTAHPAADGALTPVRPWWVAQQTPNPWYGVVRLGPPVRGRRWSTTRVSFPGPGRRQFARPSTSRGRDRRVRDRDGRGGVVARALVRALSPRWPRPPRTRAGRRCRVGGRLDRGAVRRHGRGSQRLLR